MLGTLNAALEVRGIKLEPAAISATAEGTNEVRDRVPVLTGVHVRYRLVIPPGSREVVDRALASHADKCPTARSLKGAVDVTWTADIREGAA
jgi:organic hydroperoxide reductase OsmC/OhrA